MSFDDPDRWRRGYDEWKLRAPEDEYWYADEPPECEHEQFDVDLESGEAECKSCDHTWLATPEQIAVQAKIEEDWARLVKRQARPWNRLWRRWRYSRAFRWWVRTPIYQRYSRWIFNRKHPVVMDDDIPF